MCDDSFDRQTRPLLSTLFGAAMKLTKDRDEANDLVQETMLRALRFWGSFEQGTNLKAWLLTILRNTFINHYHRERRRSEVKADAMAQMQSLGLVANGAPAPRPDETAEANATKRAVQAALRQMPEHYRMAIELYEFECWSYKDIAEEMGCPIGTVMSRIYRGRRLLHSLLCGHARELHLVEGEAV